MIETPTFSLAYIQTGSDGDEGGDEEGQDISSCKLGLCVYFRVHVMT